MSHTSKRCSEIIVIKSVEDLLTQSESIICWTKI